MPIDSVKIKMYRHGFGDCFLLQFFQREKRSFTMLIDCGLKHKDKVPGVSLNDVENDIRKTLLNGEKKKKPHLDVLVATHEHWDHVSGFHPDEDLFGDFSIGKIWMAWTESPDDNEARMIKRHLNRSIKALKLASKKVKDAKSSKPGFYNMQVKGDMKELGQQKFTETLEKVTEFFGPLGLETASGIKLKDKYKISLNTVAAMDRLKSLATKESGIQCHYPGDLITLPAKLPGVRIYVLGPPKGALLNKDTPSSGANKEVYFGLGNAAMAGFVNGLLAMGDVNGNAEGDGNPFNDVVTVSEKDAVKEDYYKKTYFSKSFEWREVSEDWLNLSGALAMQLDNDTNNTSLALAIELPGGKVLLFPGDAQVGNWLSWHNQVWKVKNSTSKESVTAKQLLENTVFYKAGHHLSHNATLEKLGLELMKSDELVAFIPEKQDQYNGIPYEPLIDRLRAKTRGRFIFSADSNYPAEKILTKKPAGLSQEEWQEFKNALKINKLFVEYTITV
jgi:hypothetical protein